MKLPLMPKATAIWLIDNTSLSFTQISEFCGLHELEVQGIADGEVAVGMRGFDPIDNKQLTSEEIKRCEKDDAARLELISSLVSCLLSMGSYPLIPTATSPSAIP